MNGASTSQDPSKDIDDHGPWYLTLDAIHQSPSHQFFVRKYGSVEKARTRLGKKLKQQLPHADSCCRRCCWMMRAACTTGNLYTIAKVSSTSHFYGRGRSDF